MRARSARGNEGALATTPVFLPTFPPLSAPARQATVLSISHAFVHLRLRPDGQYCDLRTS